MHRGICLLVGRRDLPDGSELAFYRYSMTDHMDTHYLITIWYKPVSTMRSLLASGGGHGVACGIAGLLGVFLAYRLSSGSVSEIPGLFAYPFGLVGGIAGLYFFAMLVRNFGRWFGGQSNLRFVRTAMGLGLLPWMLLAGLLSATLFSSMEASSVSVLLPAFFVLFLYGYVLLLIVAMNALGLGALQTTLVLALSMVVTFFLVNTVAQLLVRIP